MKKVILSTCLILISATFSSSVYALDYFFANVSLTAGNNFTNKLVLNDCAADGGNEAVSRFTLRFTARTGNSGYVTLGLGDGTVLTATIDALDSNKISISLPRKVCIRSIQVGGFGAAKITYTGL